MDLRLDGKVALVTGASKGIGQAIAGAMAASGAAVMISSRQPDALEQAVAPARRPGAGRRRAPRPGGVVRGQRRRCGGTLVSDAPLSGSSLGEALA